MWWARFLMSYSSSLVVEVNGERVNGESVERFSHCRFLSQCFSYDNNLLIMNKLMKQSALDRSERLERILRRKILPRWQALSQRIPTLKLSGNAIELDYWTRWNHFDDLMLIVLIKRWSNNWIRGASSLPKKFSLLS